MIIYNIKHSLLNLLKHIPLTLKMISLTIMIGVAVWIVLDYFLTQRMKSIFQGQLIEKLAKNAMEDRLKFDRHVKTFGQLVRLYVTQKNFIDYIDSNRRSPSGADQVKYHRQPPPWFPERSVLRTFLQSRYALLLDSRGRVREFYQARQGAIPPSLLSPSLLLIQKSHDQAFMTSLNDSPYIVVAESYFNKRNELQATLVLASPIDDVFLSASLGADNQDHLVALLTVEQKNRILTSNNLEKLPAGTLLESLKNRYLITGKEFFDYGASELLVQLVSFVAIDEINLLSKPVILRAREERSLLAVSLILAFALIMYWITLRLQKITRNITDVSQNMLGTKPKGIQKGDQLQILEERFKTFLLQDIVDMKTHRDALEHRAMHDFLTGLPNRALLQDRLQQAVLTGQREGKPLAFLMMDLDRFKKINDSFGHQIGDLLLKKVGKRMSGVLRKTDTLARLGGDEFALVLPAANAEHAKRTAHKLLKSLKDPFIVDNHTLQIGTSIGVAMFPEHGEDIGRLLHRADVAMYVAKKTGTGLSLFQPEYDQYHSEYYVLSRDLKNALDGEELFVYFQPKVDMKTGGVSGVEGLLRWHHPKYGFIPPDKIIPLAETLGLIKPLTLLVLKSVFHHYGEWHRDGIDSEMCISVNLSRHNLQDLDFPGEVDDLLKTLDVEPSRIVFEITEGAVMADPEHVLPTLQQLTSMGIRISVDDFGTGFSSLAYLNKMPLYEIKIDKSFVMNMETNANDSSIVRSSIQLAHNFGLSVVAEGVECQNTWALLEGFGCDSVQGYHLCRPLPAQEFKDWLNERHSRLAEKDLNMR